MKFLRSSRRKKIKGFFIFFTAAFIYSQNVDLYISLINEGKIDGVRENLSELISKYPKDPGVLYLKALLTEDGDSAIGQYKNIVKNFPNSVYAPNCAMKLGEYLYSKGLYTQSANLLKNIPLKYPRYKEMQRLTNLMISSFNAIGEADSAKYYGLLIKSMFPSIEANFKNENKLIQVFDFNRKKKNRGPYVVQLGAFNSKENANRLKLQVSQLGHDVSINEVDSNNRTFFAVRVNRFKTKIKADEIGKDIKTKLGVNYKVLYRPIK